MSMGELPALAGLAHIPLWQELIYYTEENGIGLLWGGNGGQFLI